MNQSKHYKRIRRVLLFVTVALFFWLTSGIQLAQNVESDSNAAIARRLSSPDPIQRQSSAEELAVRAAVDQKKLLEGYYLVEKDRKVRLALEWALYRVGKSDLLFNIVRELNSSRHDQAVGYLRQLDSPKILYPFLAQRDNPSRVQVGLLEALADLGDTETLELVKPFRDSFASGVAAAAELTIDTIEARVAKVEDSPTGRPRSVGSAPPSSP